MKPIILFTIACLIFASAYASNHLPDKGLPPAVSNQIKSDYSTKAATIVADSTKKENLTLTIQTNQTFQFKTFNKEFAVLPFTYLPNEPEKWRKCMIRVFAMPGYLFLQDLEATSEDIPCNGVLSLSFKDVTSDGNGEIIALFDSTTSGNKSIDPEVAVYLYDPTSQKFISDEMLSNKAVSKRVTTMKDVLQNLQVRTRHHSSYSSPSPKKP